MKYQIGEEIKIEGCNKILSLKIDGIIIEIDKNGKKIYYSLVNSENNHFFCRMEESFMEEYIIKTK